MKAPVCIQLKTSSQVKCYYLTNQDEFLKDFYFIYPPILSMSISTEIQHDSNQINIMNK